MGGALIGAEKHPCSGEHTGKAVLEPDPASDMRCFFACPPGA